MKFKPMTYSLVVSCQYKYFSEGGNTLGVFYLKVCEQTNRQAQYDNYVPDTSGVLYLKIYEQTIRQT